MLSWCRCGCPGSEGPYTRQNTATVSLTKLAKIETFAGAVCPGEGGCALLSSLPFTNSQFNFLNPKVSLPKHHNMTWL